MLNYGSEPLFARLGFTDLSFKFILHSFNNVDEFAFSLLKKFLFCFAAFNIRIY